VIHVYEELDSTNTRALTLLSQGALEGTTVIARSQTAGRGQRGHTWESTRGGIYLSVILKPTLPLPHLLQITLWSAWGVCWALRRQGIPVQLKWPNDLVVGSQKLGGLLTETKIQGDHLLGAVVGVGINGANLVPDTATTLAALQAHFDYETSLYSVQLGLDVGYRIWQRRGFGAIAQHYRRWWMNMGQNTPQGIVSGIDALGRVQLQQDNGDQYFYPGQIQLGYTSRP
jgi:BirA family transcriptional regulator, biotin operon repressor / biotin---[acetyl-CoA-carboxylase] ligase